MDESGDPWDSGYLRESVLNHLEQWIPRKPTLIILDDPPYGYAAKVIEKLAAQSYRFQKPVRVFIVNQTVSSQLYVLYQQYKRNHAKINLVVKQSVGLTTENISVTRQFVHAYKQPNQLLPQLRRDADYKQLLAVTQGNTLLLELAIPLLLKGNPLYELNKETILEERVTAVMHKLKHQVRLNEHAVNALIVATLADGPEFENWTKALQQQLALKIEEIPTIDTIARAFPYSRKTGRLLRYRENTRAKEFIDAPPRVPVLRPDLIADQLIYRIIANQGESLGQQNAQQLIAAAWACNNTSGTMRTIERWSRQHGNFIAEAFEQSLKPGYFANREEYLMVVSELVLFHQRPYQSLLGALENVAPSELDNYLQRLTQALITPGIDSLLMLQWVTHLMTTYKSAAITDYKLALKVLKLATQCFNRSYIENNGEIYRQGITELWSLCIECLKPHKKTVFNQDLVVIKDLVKAIKNQKNKAEPLLKHLLLTLADLPWQSQRETWLIWCQIRNDWAGWLTHLAIKNPQHKAELEQHINQLSDELSSYDSDHELYAQYLVAKRLEIYFHSLQTQGIDAERAESLANALDVSAQVFSDQLAVIQIERMQYWRYVIYAYCKLPAGQGAEKCMELVQQVETIATHFANDNKPIQLELARSWRFVIYAYSQLPSGQGAEQCLELVQRVETIADHFSDDREQIQLELASSWRFVIGAYNQLPAGQGAEQCLELLQRVKKIATHFPNDHEHIQLILAKSWRHVIDASCQLPAGQGAEQCLELAQRVEIIATHFPDDHEPIQLELARSWRYVISAYCLLPAGQGAEQCLKWVQRVETIADHFPNDHLIQVRLAYSLDLVIYAYSLLPAGQGADKCLELVQRVETIAAHFPYDREKIQLELALSWRFVIFAYSELPAGQGAEQCLELAQRVKTIAAHFPDDHEQIQFQLAESWRYVIYAYRQLPVGQGVEQCVEFVQQIENISAHFSDHEDIQEARSRSWRWTANALVAQQSTTAKKQNIQNAIKIILSIATRFPQNSSIKEDEHVALRLLSQ